MPKHVDHEQRRDQIAEAAFRVIARDGISATSVRAVIAESGLSSGAIRHYFTTHDELLHHVGDYLIDRAAKRIFAVREEVLDPLDSAFEQCAQLLPLDRERADELTAFAELAELTRTDPGHDGYRVRARDGVRATARYAVDRLAGQDSPEQVRRASATRLHWILDGLAAQHVLYPGTMTAAELETELRTALRDLRAELT